MGKPQETHLVVNSSFQSAWRKSGRCILIQTSNKVLYPTFFAVWQPVLEVEGRVGEDLSAVGAHEALGMEGAVHRLQAVLK